MVSSQQINDRFHRALHERLSDYIASLMEGLAKGSAGQLPGEAASTAEKYAGQVARIAAMTEVLDLCEEIERDFYGPSKQEAAE